MDPPAESPLIEEHAAEMHRSALMHEIGQFKNGYQINRDLKCLQDENYLYKSVVVQLLLNDFPAEGHGDILYEAEYTCYGEEETDAVEAVIVTSSLCAVESYHC